MSWQPTINQRTSSTTHAATDCPWCGQTIHIQVTVKAFNDRGTTSISVEHTTRHHDCNGPR